jgi:drug/metabolite transporter (DMT)-like permease
LVFTKQKMTSKQKAYAALHICVLIWGFTAILGKLISVQALSLVWWRTAICVVALGIFIPKRQLRAVSWPQVWRLLGIGAIVGLHWLCFYGAIKLANASVAVVAMATATFFAAFAEPLLLKQPFKWYELLLGVLILPGMWLIVGDLNANMQVGLAVGVLAALLAAVFTALNKLELNRGPVPPLAMSLIELTGGCLVMSVVTAIMQPDMAAFWPKSSDWTWLLTLSLVCTLLPYYLTLRAMRHISAFATNLTINLEPVYGVILAGVLFREDLELTPGFYVGMGIVLSAVFGHPLLKWWLGRRLGTVNSQD